MENAILSDLLSQAPAETHEKVQKTNQKQLQLLIGAVEMRKRHRKESMQISSPTFCHCSVVVVLINSVLQVCPALFGCLPFRF
jgi:23S rRNA pseudoU1915 N3-methylase RlmH